MTTSSTQHAACSHALSDQVRERLHHEPQKMTSQLARELGAPEASVIRCLPPEQVTELDASRWQELIQQFERFGKTHVIVTSSGGVTLEVNGEFGKFSTWMGYFNVQTPSLDMHIREEAVAAVFAVEKPSHMDGVKVLSFQFYDAQGTAAFKVFLSFGGKQVPAERRAMFDELRLAFAMAP